MAGWRQRLGFSAKDRIGRQSDNDGPLERDWSELEDRLRSERIARALDESRAPETNVEAQLEKVSLERDRLRARVFKLEEMLQDPEKGQNAILYFRLRALWKSCNQDLELLSKQFQEKYLSRAEPLGGKSSSAHDSESEEAFKDATRQAEEWRKRIASIRYELDESDVAYNSRKRADLTVALQQAESRLREAEVQIEELREGSGHFSESVIPTASRASAELSVNIRRAINTLLLALSQHYYLLYREDQIAEAALSAAKKPVEDSYFGIADDCIRMERKVSELMAAAGREIDRQAIVRRRASYLHGRLRYSNEKSAIPLTESLNTLPSRVGVSEEPLSSYGEMLPVNVYSLNYWNVRDVLLP